MLHVNNSSPDVFWRKRWPKQQDYFELCHKSLTSPKEGQIKVICWSYKSYKIYYMHLLYLQLFLFFVSLPSKSFIIYIYIYIYIYKNIYIYIRLCHMNRAIARTHLPTCLNLLMCAFYYTPKTGMNPLKQAVFHTPRWYS